MSKNVLMCIIPKPNSGSETGKSMMNVCADFLGPPRHRRHLHTPQYLMGGERTHELEGVDSTLGGEWVVPDGCYVEEDSNHKESKQLQAEASNVSVIYNSCGHVVTNQRNTCKHQTR